MEATAESWRDLCPARLLARHEEHDVYQVDGNVYVFEGAGHLTSDLMYRCFESCWRAPGFQRPYGVVYVVNGQWTYDPDLRTFHERPNLTSAAAVSVVIDSVLARMVLSTVGIATRLKHGTELTAYGRFEDAIQAVRRVVAARGS